LYLGLLTDAGRKSDISHGEGIEVVRTAVEQLDVASHATTNALRDLSLQIQQNSSQLELLGSSISDSLDVIRDTVTRTEWVVRDLEQSMTTNFTVVQTDMRSIASSSLVTSQAMAELLAKMDSVSQQVSGLVSCPPSAWDEGQTDLSFGV
jgi:hypothetical protein